MENITSWFDDTTPILTPAIFLMVLAALFYVLWMSEIIPALINGTVPASVKESGLITQPVHILDVALALPGLIIAAMLLIKKHAFGYVLTPALIIFALLMACAIGGMVVVMHFKGFDAAVSLIIIFALIAFSSGMVFIFFVKHIKK